MSSSAVPFDWTDEREAKLTKQWLAGVPRKEIASGFGVSENAVAGKAHRLGLRRDRAPVSQAALQKKVVKRIRANKKQAQKDATKAAPQPAQAIVKALPPPPKPQALSTAITLVHARPWHARAIGQCAYPVGERGPWGFADLLSCCAPVQDKKSYCPGHQKLMFLPPSGKRGTVPFKIRIGHR